MFGAYQSVPSSEVTITVTSGRMRSTSCAYQSGYVSLSPKVIRMPYGSTELRTSCAQSRVNVSPARDASRQLATSGMSATASTGAATAHARTGDRSRPASCSDSHAHAPARPTATHTDQAEKLQMKK